jgi:hypothetical protein
MLVLEQQEALVKELMMLETPQQQKVLLEVLLKLLKHKNLQKMLI